MSEIKAGVVVVTKFCKASSQKFKSYINYIDRKEAVRSENAGKYNLYQEYMGNPEKTSGLFTKNEDLLSKEQKEELKNEFSTAQDNGSLMWQTVISFDNKWLQEHGLYEDGELDEKKIKEVTRNAVAELQKKENLQNAVWSAAIHYNTDNIHVHIAMTEPEPMREKKEYTQYEYKFKDGKRVREEKLDKNGEPIKKEEYKGRFKNSSIKSFKSSIVNQIIEEKEYNRKINDIIRNTIVKGKRENPLVKDQDLAKAFLEIYNKLPKENKSLWNYNSNSIAFLKDDIDALSKAFIEKYYKEDFEKLQDIIDEQDKEYKKAYGNSSQGFKDKKIQDLYTRTGNAILQEMKNYDKELNDEKDKRATHGTLKKNVNYGSNQDQDRNSSYHLQLALKKMINSMKTQYETWKNICEYEQMQDQKKREEEKEY